MEKPLRLTWNEFTALPMKDVVADMHCVTRWSRFDVRWRGVPFTELMNYRLSVKPDAKYVMVLAEQGYTANVPLVDLLQPATRFALEGTTGSRCLPITDIRCGWLCPIFMRGKA